MTQQERLDYLVEAFLEESDDCRGMEPPEAVTEKQRMLRSLMNVRMPRRLPEKTLAVQDEYLGARAEEKGIVTLDTIPTIAEALQSKHPHASQISIWQGDITRLAVDAIVNAANSQMLGCFVPCHSCIDNCIHTYAGVQLRAECEEKMRALRERHGRDYEQPTAIPLLTDAYNLPSKKVIHVVGPIVGSKLTGALETDLIDCYRNTLELCAAHGLKSVAFCCISTGVFHFPNQRAAELATATVREWLTAHPDQIERVIFNVFLDKDRDYYEEYLRC